MNGREKKNYRYCFQGMYVTPVPSKTKRVKKQKSLIRIGWRRITSQYRGNTCYPSRIGLTNIRGRFTLHPRSAKHNRQFPPVHSGPYDPCVISTTSAGRGREGSDPPPRRHLHSCRHLPTTVEDWGLHREYKKAFATKFRHKPNRDDFLNIFCFKCAGLQSGRTT